VDSGNNNRSNTFQHTYGISHCFCSLYVAWTSQFATCIRASPICRNTALYEFNPHNLTLLMLSQHFTCSHQLSILLPSVAWLPIANLSVVNVAQADTAQKPFRKVLGLLTLPHKADIDDQPLERSFQGPHNGIASS